MRVAPNEISISDPEAVSTIYGIKSKFTKVQHTADTIPYVNTKT